jgi:hypothetical protein
MFGLIRGAVRSAVGGIVLVAAVAGVGYWKLAASKVPAADGAVVTLRIASATPSLSGATLPWTFEAYVKDRAGHNLLDSGTAAGLVTARYEWSHGSFQWVPDAGFFERQGDVVYARKRLARRDVAALIKDLRSEDVVAREISSKELLIRTGQSFGYAYDAPAAEREKAAALWERWWASDDNRAQYGAKRVLDYADGALETLRKAIGEPKAPPPEGGATPPATSTSTGTSASGKGRGGARN